MMTTAQTNFVWEKIDSCNKTKEQIYSDTKMFIAENWVSANDVIQNDDKETGSILVKGTITQTEIVTMYSHEWVFSYTVSFLIKDNKFKIKIYNVRNSVAPSGYTSGYRRAQPMLRDLIINFLSLKGPIHFQELGKLICLKKIIIHL